MSGIDNCESCSGTAPDTVPSSDTRINTPSQSSTSTSTSSTTDSRSTPQPASKTVIPQAFDTTLGAPSSSSPKADTGSASGIIDSGAKGNAPVAVDPEAAQPSVEDIHPPAPVYPSVVIEFCDRCRWCVPSWFRGAWPLRRILELAYLGHRGCILDVTCTIWKQSVLTHRAPRATWVQTELFLTFPSPALRSITLIPLNTPETGGRFRVWVDIGDGRGQSLMWDRKVSDAVSLCIEEKSMFRLCMLVNTLLPVSFPLILHLELR